MNRNCFIVLMLSIAITSQLSSQSKLSEKLLINRSKSNFIKLIDFLSTDDLSLDDLESIRNIDITPQYTLWEDYTRIVANRYDRYVSFGLNIGAIEDKIFYLRINISDDDANMLQRFSNENVIIKNHLKQYWHSSEILTNCEGLEFEYFYLNEDLQKDYELSVAKDLGIVKSFDIQEEFKGSYDILMDASHYYDYGDSCYYSGVKPTGKVAIEQLVDAGRFDLVKNIIRGFNPEGRAYGIEALLKANSTRRGLLTDTDREVIKTLISIDMVVNHCSGCIVGEYTYDVLFGGNDF